MSYQTENDSEPQTGGNSNNIENPNQNPNQNPIGDADTGLADGHIGYNIYFQGVQPDRR